MRFRDSESRRVFWNGVGCILTTLLGLLATSFIVVFLIIPAVRDGHVDSYLVCPSPVSAIRYDLKLFQNGTEWKKEIQTRSVMDSEYDTSLLIHIHDSQLGVFFDITDLMWCAPGGGIVVRGTLKNASQSALFLIEPNKRISVFGEQTP